MTQNVIIMIGDGMGWEMARAAAIYQQTQQGNTGSNVNNFYTSGTGTGLNFQTLTGYTFATTYGTTIAGSNGVFNNGNSALDGADSVTAGSAVRQNFQFNPGFNPGNTATGGATVSSGATGNLVGYDPVRGGATPWDPAYYGGTPGAGFDKEYIKYSYPDSANTATTLYTGVKSYNNAIGVDIYEQPLETILTTANLVGKSTGLVTSVPIDHATPGAASAAVNRRNKYDSEFPSLESILQQQLSVYQPTVLLGGGHPLSNTLTPLSTEVEPPQVFDFITDDTYQYLQANPTNNRYNYNFLERGANAANVLATTAAGIDPNQGERLLGIYGARGQNGNLPVSSANGDYSTTGLDMFSLFSTQGNNPDRTRPLLPGETDAQFIARERDENPTLAQLTGAALEVLEDDPDGFWLMVEGGDIDWSAHDNNMDNLIGTVLDFDKAVKSVIDWIQANGGWENNLLVVTADHDHYLTLNPNYPQLLQTSGADGLTSTSTTANAGHFWGSDSTVKYGWGTHSNRPVPVYYQGSGADVLTGSVGQAYQSYGSQVPGFPGHVDQSQIYQAMLAAITGSTSLPNRDGDQKIFGDDKDDVVYTGVGNDTIYANGGDNHIFANQGDNQVFARSGNDVVYSGTGKDVVYANDGDNAIWSGAGDDKLYAGDGNDQIYAGAGDDLIYANGGDNIIVAGPGNDKVYAGSGDDFIETGSGDDLIYANGGKNVINTGTGNDTVYTGSAVDRFILNAGDGFVTIIGWGPNDVISRGSGLTGSSSSPAPTLSINVIGNDTQILAGTDLLATVKSVRLPAVPTVV